MDTKLAVVTGANSGIGLSLCERLLAEHGADKLRLCLACRNSERAIAAQKHLHLLHPMAVIDIVLADFSSIQSVKRAAVELQQKYSHIDFLYLNAGIMPNPKVDVASTIQTLFSRDVFKKLALGEGFLQYSDSTTADGLQLTFATNVFGHFMLVHEIKSILGGSTPTLIIWTSSTTAKKEVFHLQDIQHCSGEDPYGSSKYLSDLLSIAFNEKFNDQNIYSFTVCPGLVMTQLTYTILPQWVWTYILVPICRMLRHFVPTFTLDSEVAVEALVWLAKQQPKSLDIRTKYRSFANIWGKPYVQPDKLSSEDHEAADAYQALLTLYSSYATDNS